MSDQDNKNRKPGDDKPEAKKAPPTIEQHAQELGVPAWQFAGVKARNEWPEGKVVSRAEFEIALDAWLNGPTVKSAYTPKDGE